jgi:hypothetical protein
MMRDRSWPVWSLLAFLIALPHSFAEEPSREALALFREKIAPVLRTRCVRCHHPGKTRGGLNLTTRKSILAGGDSGPAANVGDPQKSLLLHMVQGPDPLMPRNGPALGKEDIGYLIKWLELGLPWARDVVLGSSTPAPAEETWWSLRPLSQPAIPAVKDRSWVRNPVDAFILAKLESKGLQPAAEAERRLLIRRLTYDLHGLPPKPEEVQAFVDDPRPDAYERLVDRLLASPAYGERWARHWLDVAHYGDTHGYDKDKRRDHAWPYRDYVIDSFNHDKPYAQFIREQLAGDVLYPAPTPEGIVATGFVVAGPWDFVGQVELREGTVDKMKTRLIDRDDMVANTCSTFLSLTVHCARCHDHKFDPISQKEYYALQAVFAGVERGDRPYAIDPRRQAARDQLVQEQQRLETRQAMLEARVRKLTAPELSKLDVQLEQASKELAALPPLPKGAPSRTNGYHSAILPRQEETRWVQVDLGQSVPIDKVCLIPARPVDFPDTPGFGFPVRFRVEIAEEPTFEKATCLADHTAQDFPNPGDSPVLFSARGNKARYVRVTATRLWLRRNDYVFALAELQVLSGGKNLASGGQVSAQDSIEAGRWSKKHLVDGFDSRNRLPDPSDHQALQAYLHRAELTARVRDLQTRRKALVDSLLGSEVQKERSELARRLAELKKQIREWKSDRLVYAVLPRRPRPVWVLQRGDVRRRGQAALPGGLSCVQGLAPDLIVPNPDQEGQRRLGLANWIADPDNSLTWRSIVNRVWHYHFGKGIVDTPNDFGRNGSLPTHPELLDWLACTFRAQGGSFKQLHRLLVLSSTYRQSSRRPPGKAGEIDANNRYLWRMNRRRLDAESVRDSVLAISGQLRKQMGGPGFELFRFKDDHSPIYDHTAREKILDPRTFRRTVYRFIVRSVPNPFMESLDCADPNNNVPVRNTTLTALQALTLLNDPFMIHQAERFAERLQSESPDLASQIDRAFQLTFARSPRPDERKLLANYIHEHGLVNACRVLLNANEFVFVD